MRNIEASWTNRKGEVRARRTYVRLNTAIPTMTFHFMEKAEPGDTVEFYHVNTGMQIGTMRMKAGGKIKTEWVWD